MFFISTIVILIQAVGLTDKTGSKVIAIISVIPILSNILGIVGSLLLSGGNKKGIGFIISTLTIDGLVAVLNVNISSIVAIIIKAIFWAMAISNIKESKEKANRTIPEKIDSEDVLDLNYAENIVVDKQKNVRKDYLETIVKKGESLESKSFVEKIRYFDSKADINKSIKKLIMIGISITLIFGMVVFDTITANRYMRMNDKKVIVIVVISIIYFIGIILFVNKNKLGPYLIFISTLALIFINQRKSAVVILGIMALVVWLITTLKVYRYMSWNILKEVEKTNYNNHTLEKAIKVILSIKILISIMIIFYYINIYRRGGIIRFSKKYFVLYGLGLSMYIVTAVIFIKTRFNKLATFIGSGILSVIMMFGIYYKRVLSLHFDMTRLTIHCKVLKMFYLLLFCWVIIVLIDLIRTIISTKFVDDIEKYI